MFHRKNLAVCVSVAALLAAAPAFSEDMGYSENTLTGNWGGARQKLADKGVTVDLVYKQDVMSVVSGGNERGTRLLDNQDLIIGLDGEKLFGIKGNSAVIQFLNNMGAEPDGSLIGSLGGVDNIETAYPTGKLYQAFVQQNFLDDSLSVLAGVYDLNSEFYVNDPAGLFLHPTYGIGTDMAQSGLNGPSIFPTTSLSARVRYHPCDMSYLQFAVLDAVPGDTRNGKGTHIFHKIGGNDGALMVAEGGLTPEGSKIAAGYWRYTEKFDDLTRTNALGAPLREHAQGFYLLGDHQFYKEEGSDTQGLAAFARLGFANDEVHPVDYSWAVGAVYTGLFPSRDDGQLGLAVSGAHLGKDYRVANGAESSETQLELTYSDNLTPWLAIQPDVQYIMNPGANPTEDDALVLGTRLTLSF